MAAVVGLWLLLQAWQPLVLGFYGDDWAWPDAALNGGPFSAERFLQSGVWGVSRSRPMYALAYFVTSSLAGSSAVRIRFIASVVLLATMVAVYLFTQRLLRLAAIHDDRLAVWAAASWLIMPWTIFAKVSPTAELAYLSAVFFLSGAALFWSSLERDRPAWFGPSLLQLLSYLTYEAFYLQYIAVLLVAYAYNRSRRRSTFALVGPAVAFSVVQLLAIAYNRLAGSPKTPAGLRATLVKFVYNVTAGPFDVLISSAYLYAIGIVLGVLVAAALYRSTLRRLDAGEATRQRALLGGALAGAALALATYAAANYSLTGRDVYTSFSADFWLAAAGALVIGVPLTHGTLTPATRALLAVGVVCLLAAAGTRIHEWRTAGVRQEQWVAAAPVEQIRATPENAVIFYDGPTRYEGAWVYDRPSVLERRFTNRFGFFRRFYIHELSCVSWNPEQVREDLGVVGRFRTAPAIRVREPWYYWNPDTGTFRRLTGALESKDTRMETLPFSEMVKLRHWPLVEGARLIAAVRAAR